MNAKTQNCVNLFVKKSQHISNYLLRPLKCKEHMTEENMLLLPIVFSE